MEWCTIDEGTKLKGYEVVKNVLNALNTAVSEVGHTLASIGRFAYLVMPSGWVFPLINEGEWTVPTLPEQNFWATKISLKLKFFHFAQEDLNLYLPFPKHSVIEMWHSFIAPNDVYVDGSEYWPYRDENTGDIHQGVWWTPARKFGILANIPDAIIDIALVGFIIWALNAVGLIPLVKSFISALSLYVKNRRVLSLLTEEHELNLRQLQLIQQDLGIDQTTDNGVTEIISKIGLRLVFK